MTADNPITQEAVGLINGMFTHPKGAQVQLVEGITVSIPDYYPDHPFDSSEEALAAYDANPDFWNPLIRLGQGKDEDRTLAPYDRLDRTILNLSRFAMQKMMILTDQIANWHQLATSNSYQASALRATIERKCHVVRGAASQVVICQIARSIQERNGRIEYATEEDEADTDDAIAFLCQGLETLFASA